jgi:hypothetical protein
MQDTMENGISKIIAEMDMEYRFGLMVLDMKAIGSLIRLTEKED